MKKTVSQTVKRPCIFFCLSNSRPRVGWNPPQLSEGETECNTDGLPHGDRHTFTLTFTPFEPTVCLMFVDCGTERLLAVRRQC